MTKWVLPISTETKNQLFSDIALRQMTGGIMTSSDHFVRHIFDEIKKHDEIIIKMED